MICIKRKNLTEQVDKHRTTEETLLRMFHNQNEFFSLDNM